MFIKGLIASILIIISIRYISRIRIHYKFQIIENNKLLLFWGSVFTFLLFGYLIPTSYYFPHNNGVTGDNYLHMNWALTGNLYLKHHHILFPLVGEILVKGLVKIGLLSEYDPLFLEKAFWLSAFPVKISMVFALVFSAVVIQKTYKNLRLTMLWFFIISTSYASWIWGIQSNAIGIAIAIEILCISVFILWVKEYRFWQVVLVAFFTGLGVFTHIGFIYFSGGMALAVFSRIFPRKNFSRKLQLHVLTFAVITLLMGSLFYLIESEINKTYNISEMFDILSDRSNFGTFSGENVDFLGALEANLWSGVNWFANFDHNEIYKYWAPELAPVEFNLWTKSIRVLQLGTMTAILISIGIGLKNRNLAERAIFLPGLFCSLLFLIGFTIRQAGAHYYTMAIIPNIVLITSFVFSNKLKIKEIQNFFLLFALLISLNFIYNVFSNFSIFKGNDIEDHEFYNRNLSIQEFTGSDSTSYYTIIDPAYYPNFALSEYYNNKFGHIKWRTKSKDWNNVNDLIRLIQSDQINGFKSVLGNNANSQLQVLDSLNIQRIEDHLYIIRL